MCDPADSCHLVERTRTSESSTNQNATESLFQNNTPLLGRPEFQLDSPWGGDDDMIFDPLMLFHLSTLEAGHVCAEGPMWGQIKKQLCPLVLHWAKPLGFGLDSSSR